MLRSLVGSEMCIRDSHSCEAINEGHERVLVICRDTNVLLLLFHFMSTKAAEVRMISGTAKKWKCYPIHAVSERLAKPVVYNLLSFHALTGCDSTSSFSGHGKKKCWKIFQNQPLSVNGIGRDGDQAPTVCLSPVWHTCTANRRTCQASPLRKGQQGSGDALELHAARANHQAKIWLQADKEHIDVASPTETRAWKKESEGIQAVWSRLPPIPDVCLELVTCGCKSKCKTAGCSCFRKNLKCTSACGCEAIHCCSPAGQ